MCPLIFNLITYTYIPSRTSIIGIDLIEAKQQRPHQNSNRGYGLVASRPRDLGAKMTQNFDFV